MPKVKVPRLCSRSQPGIKVIIRDLRGHLLHTVTFLVVFFFHFHNSKKSRCNQCSIQNFSQIYQVVQEEKLILVVCYF